jgi:hypothetical protein
MTSTGGDLAHPLTSHHLFCIAGNGVIVDHNEEGGLIVTDRNTVCVNAGDIMLAFGAYPAEAPAKILFLHPLYNYAILSYSCKDLPQEVRIFSSAGIFDISAYLDILSAGISDICVWGCVCSCSSVLQSCFGFADVLHSAG